jgi:F0F1-type ATP synthase assembly protein I
MVQVIEQKQRDSCFHKQAHQWIVSFVNHGKCLVIPHYVFQVFFFKC